MQYVHGLIAFCFVAGICLADFNKFLWFIYSYPSGLPQCSTVHEVAWTDKGKIDLKQNTSKLMKNMNCGPYA